MKRSIAFSKNLNSLDDALPAIGNFRKSTEGQSFFNTVEADDSDADLIAQIQQPKKFHCHKSFVSYYSLDHVPTSSSSQSPHKRVSIDSPSKFPELPPCDFLTTGCARFDNILTLKENENKKRCIVTASPSEDNLYEMGLSTLFAPPRLPQLTINLMKANLIDVGSEVTEPGCSPSSIAVIDEENEDDYSRKQIGIEILSLCAIRPVHPPTSCPNPTKSTTPTRNGRLITCPRRASLVNWE